MTHSCTRRVLQANFALLIAVTASATPAFSVAAADANPNLQPFSHAADCVAALKAVSIPLADRVRAGDEGARPPLLRLTQTGFSFAGTAYKQGLGKEDANRMLAAAEEAQKRMPPSAQNKLATACVAEGDKLLAGANALERAMVDQAARKRVKKLVGS